MSLTNIIDRLYEINRDITGIETAFRRPPMALDTAELPAIMVVLDNWTVGHRPSDARQTVHHLLLRVYGTPTGQQQDVAARQEELEPFLERVLNAYDATVKLNGLSDMLAGWQGITAVRWRILPYAGTEYPALEFSLDIHEETIVTVDV